jgi:dUTP pyrophosphatase
MRDQVNVFVELCHDAAKLPEYARSGDAGMDVCAIETTVIPAGATIIIKTGLKVAIPDGYEIQIRPRSGVSLKTGLRVANSPGTIDAGYRDEIGVIITNTYAAMDQVVNKGDRIAQIVLAKVPQITWCQVASVTEIQGDRGGGFGSTGGVEYATVSR